MPTISMSTTITVPANQKLVISGAGATATATVNPGSLAQIYDVGVGQDILGPFDRATPVRVDILAGSVTYNTVSESAVNAISNGSQITDVTGQPVGGGGVYYPPTDDAAGIALAAYQARLDGGGIVQLKPITYNIPAGVKLLLGGVLYRGLLPVGTDGDRPYYVSGTRLLGPGSGTCFAANDTDRAPYPNSDALLDAAVNGGGVQDMYINNFDFGIKCGALNEAGPAYMSFKNLYLFGNKQWGMWLENYSHVDVDTIVTYENTHGVALTTSTPLYNFGNSIVKSIIGGNSQAVGSGRGLYVWAYNGSQTNAVQMYNIQVGGNSRGNNTQNTTMTNGVTDIGVTDLSQFAVGVPVKFGSANNGFNSTSTYFITAVSGTTGAGTVRVSLLDGGTPITPVANSANTIISRGFPAVTVGATPGGLVTFSSITGASDIELSGLCRILLQNIAGGRYEFGIIGNGADAALCLRGVDQASSYHVGQACVVDSDRAFNLSGALCSFPGVAPSAYMTIQTSGHGQIFLHGATPTLRTRGDAFDRCQISKFFGDHEQISNGGTLFGRNANNLTFITDTAGSSFTLQPSTSANMLGFEFAIFNATANAVTMNYNATSGTQIIVPGSGPANSYSIPAWSSIVIKLIQKGSTLYWAVLA